MNNWNFTGNVGRDAESRFTPNGDSITSFSVGVKCGFGEKATTAWANCAMFGKRGDAVKAFLVKGALVGISGEISMREWQDKEGQKRVNLDVRVNDLTLLGGKPKSQDDGYSQPAQCREPAPQRNVQGAQGGAFDDMESDIPFDRLGACGAWRVI